MLDTLFKSAGERRQVHDDLRALVGQAREERAALSAMLAQVATTSAKTARTGQALDELAAKADGVARKVEALAGMTEAYDRRVESFDQLTQRMGELLDQVAEAKRVSEALTAPDGGIQQHRLAIQSMDAQAREAAATLQALHRESDTLDALREQMRAAQTETAQTVDSVAALKGEFDALHASEGELRRALQGVQESALVARDDSAAAAYALNEVRGKLEPLERLQELSQNTETRLAALNALAEHVAHKTRALETQKQTVEHAVVEATRLNERVWAMDAQVARLAAGTEQLQRAEDAVARMEELAQSTVHELATASAARDEFVRESARLEARGRSLAEHLGAAIERLATDKKEVDAFDQRLRTLAQAVGESEARVQTVLAKDEALAAMQQRSDALVRTFATLTNDAGALARRQTELGALAEQLAQVDALARRVTTQHDLLAQSRQDIEAARGELAEFRRAHAQTVQLREQLAVDRAALETLGERTATMLGRAPDIEARLDDVRNQLALVDQGNRSAAQLGGVVSDLDVQLIRVGERLQFVGRLEERINGLHSVTTDVERKLADQLMRRAEVESLTSLCDTLATQVADAQHRLDGVAALQGRLLPMASQVATLMQTLGHSHQLVETVKQDESQIHAQQARLGELVERSQALFVETAERLRQVGAANDDLARASALKEDVLAELARVQASQREALVQTDAAEDQLQRAEGVVKQLEQRGVQLLNAEKHIAAFEGRLNELDRGAEAVEQKIRSLADREALVQAVKAEVDNIRSISQRSREDLQYVAEQRDAVSELRARIEELLGRVQDTGGRIEQIESRRQAVEEVHTRTSAITHMLGDINVNLEMLSEQRAVIDHVGDQLARLDFTVQEAQNTLRALQREREVAERIEQGIKALRARTGAA